MILLGLDEGLLVLLYLESAMTVLTADPNIETCCLDSVFAENPRGSLSCVALRH